VSIPDERIEAPPAVSVVLPVLDEEKDIRRLLDEILRQEDPPRGFEVLVVDGGSRDRTRSIVTDMAASEARLRLLHNPGVRSSAGRNVGAAAARGDYVLYIDGHCGLPRPDYLVRLVQIFEATGAACLCRPQPLMDLATEDWARAIAAARHSWLGHNPGSDIYRETAAITDPRSAGAAYRRSTVIDLGGYDERFDACEDVEFNHRVARAGLIAYRHPDLRIHYRPRTSLRSLHRQMQRYGRGRARLMAKHPEVVPWALVGISILLPAFAVGLAAAGWRRGIAGVMLAGLAYLAVTLIEGVRAAGFGLQALRTAVVFGFLHSGLFLGFWRGLGEWWRFRTQAPVTMSRAPGGAGQS